MIFKGGIMEQNIQKQLEDKIKALEARISDTRELYYQHISHIYGEFEYLFERVKNLEVSVFPNLMEDIARVHDIIGDSADVVIGSTKKPPSHPSS